MLAHTDSEGPVVWWGGGIRVPVYVEFWGGWLDPNNNTCWQTPASYSVNRNTKSLGFQCNIPSRGSSGAWREHGLSVSTASYPTSGWFIPVTGTVRGTGKLGVQGQMKEFLKKVWNYPYIWLPKWRHWWRRHSTLTSLEWLHVGGRGTDEPSRTVMGLAQPGSPHQCMSLGYYK